MQGLDYERILGFVCVFVGLVVAHVLYEQANLDAVTSSFLGAFAFLGMVFLFSAIATMMEK